jgi:hypothetical protein
VSGTGRAITEDLGFRRIFKEFLLAYVNTGLRKYEKFVNVPGEIIESIRIISKENTSEPKSHPKDMIAENMMAKNMIVK